MAYGKEQTVTKTQLQFMFPFSLKKNFNSNLIQLLFQLDYEFFHLKNKGQEDRFYGRNHVSHRNLGKFFLPNIENILFPLSPQDEQGLRRMTKNINLDGEFQSSHVETSFHIPSVDIIICPYQIGLMNLRVNIPGGMALSEVLEFVSEFRSMEPLQKNDSVREIRHGGKSYKKMMDFIFGSICPPLRDYLEEQDRNTSYFGSLPFFVDERMYVIGYYQLKEEDRLGDKELFRIGHLYGFNKDGAPYTGANSKDYLRDFYKSHVYERWADETHYVVSDYTFSCVTRCPDDDLKKELGDNMYGIHYYSILYYFFYKVVLMKLSYEQAEINLGKGQKHIEELILKITTFSAKYYFHEVNTSTVGKEIYQLVKQVFHIEQLYTHVAGTLNNLYKNHDKLISKRHNYLLQLLTVYTVISGIYGMNLAIPDFEKGMDWSRLAEYNLLEWIALIVTFSGITLGIILGISFLIAWYKEKRKDESNFF